MPPTYLILLIMTKNLAAIRRAAWKENETRLAPTLAKIALLADDAAQNGGCKSVELINFAKAINAHFATFATRDARRAEARQIINACSEQGTPVVLRRIYKGINAYRAVYTSWFDALNTADLTAEGLAKAHKNGPIIVAASEPILTADGRPATEDIVKQVQAAAAAAKQVADARAAARAAARADLRRAALSAVLLADAAPADAKAAAAADIAAKAAGTSIDDLRADIAAADAAAHNTADAPAAAGVDAAAAVAKQVATEASAAKVAKKARAKARVDRAAADAHARRVAKGLTTDATTPAPADAAPAAK